jgi:hypothetical protein
MDLTTYEATFATGWKATVRETSIKEARKRLRITGRGERFTVKATAKPHAIWGFDGDDDYEEGE